MFVSVPTGGVCVLEGRIAVTALGEQRVFLAHFDRYQIEGRYLDLLPPAPDIETARQELGQAQEVFEWLNRQL